MTRDTYAHPDDGSRDVVQAVAELAERLPDALQPLAHLAFNYRWSWLPGGPQVFRDLDPQLWERRGYDGETGWAIASPDADAATQDDHDAAALYDLLEHEIIPLFYQRDVDGLPRRWIGRIKASMQRLIPRFSAERMLRDYVRMLYSPQEPE
jgi:glucan phosphorylase